MCFIEDLLQGNKERYQIELTEKAIYRRNECPKDTEALCFKMLPKMGGWVALKVEYSSAFLLDVRFDPRYMNTLKEIDKVGKRWHILKVWEGISVDRQTGKKDLESKIQRIGPP